MQRHDAFFIKSIGSLRDRPNPQYKEIAVAGRSNVGKSTLINTLFNRRNLAKVSSSPGKTRLINYYSINNVYYLVDLPGYGFARRSKEEQKKWRIMLESYLSANDRIIYLLLLIDSRRGILEIDRIMINWLNYFKLPFTVILTKTDKLSGHELLKKKNELSMEIPDVEVISFSAKSRSGKPEILDLIEKKILT